MQTIIAEFPKTNVNKTQNTAYMEYIYINAQMKMHGSKNIY